MSHIPATRDNALYSKVLQTLREAKGPMLAKQLKAHRSLAPKLKGQRPNRINEVLSCLKTKSQVQMGYDENGNKLWASIEKPFPGTKEGPTRADGTPKWSRKGTAPLEESINTDSASPTEDSQQVHTTSVQTSPPTSTPGADQPVPTLSLDAQAQQFAEAIASAICVRIINALHAQLPAHIDHIVTGYRSESGDRVHGKGNGKAHAPDLPRSKVIVAGLKPEQAGFMDQEFGKKLDLAFVQSNELMGNPQRINQLVQSHDFAFAMINFVNHGMCDKLKKNKHYRPISGGMSSLRDHLRAIVATQIENQQTTQAAH